jgi:outer membrane protein OmpA-like peptidoglycan-associated protein
VRRWFTRNGLGDVQFSSKGFGETRPVAPNTKDGGVDDPEGRQKNRRVEIVIRKRG